MIRVIFLDKVLVSSLIIKFSDFFFCGNSHYQRHKTVWPFTSFRENLRFIYTTREKKKEKRSRLKM